MTSHNIVILLYTLNEYQSKFNGPNWKTHLINMYLIFILASFQLCHVVLFLIHLMV